MEIVMNMMKKIIEFRKQRGILIQDLRYVLGLEMLDITEKEQVLFFQEKADKGPIMMFDCKFNPSIILLHRGQWLQENYSCLDKCNEIYDWLDANYDKRHFFEGKPVQDETLLECLEKNKNII